jgi:hypothetical protein
VGGGGPGASAVDPFLKEDFMGQIQVEWLSETKCVVKDEDDGAWVLAYSVDGIEVDAPGGEHFVLHPAVARVLGGQINKLGRYALAHPWKKLAWK